MSLGLLDASLSYSAACHLNAGSSPVHPPGPQESDLPEANSLTQSDEDNAVVGSSHHLDCSWGHDEHLHSNISFLRGLGLTLNCCFYLIENVNLSKIRIKWFPCRCSRREEIWLVSVCRPTSWGGRGCSRGTTSPRWWSWSGCWGPRRSSSSPVNTGEFPAHQNSSVCSR